MAEYTYSCTACSYTVTQRRTMQKSQLIDGCPRCGAQMRREWRAPAKPIFKGDGFYETDYKRRGDE